MAESEATRTHRPGIGQFSASQDHAANDRSCGCDGTDQFTSSPQHSSVRRKLDIFPQRTTAPGGAAASRIARLRALVSRRRRSSTGENSTWCREPPARTTIPYGGRIL